MKRIIQLFFIFCLASQILTAQEQPEETPVRFSVGYGFYPLKYENISCFSMKVDVKRENKLPISFFVNTLHLQGTFQLPYNTNTFQIGIGYTRFSTNPNTWFIDPFVHVLFERIFHGRDDVQYYGLALNGGVQAGYRFNNLSIGLSVHSAYGIGKSYFPKDPYQQNYFAYHFYYPTPMLNLSLTV